MLLKYRLKDLWWKVRHFFFPCQQWLIDKIPNDWVDKDTLWEICIFEGIKHYVEGEKALEHFETSQADPDYPEYQKLFDRQVKWNYELVTIVIPDLQKQLDAEWRKIPMRGWDNLFTEKHRDVHTRIDKLEEEIESTTTDIMIWAVKNRGRLWT